MGNMRDKKRKFDRFFPAVAGVAHIDAYEVEPRGPND